ncbi:MAG TPA: ClpXP protease specificity-enhancing factor SspB [Xanthobacteraceae bacterium]|nr:ClpXP protease specificity-enhancing factor SspB [Xanthobacteraceae bacterium]
MSVDHIRYDLLTQDALRGVIRTVLTDVAVKGLPGEHHFFITFDTRADGVRMSARLKASYPGEMTIVLQHQFWDLAVGEDDFDVGLAFNGIPERLHIPFKAVRAFMDPSVQFGLQFTVDVEAAKEADPDVPADAPAAMTKPARGEKPTPAKQGPVAKSPKPPKPSKKEPGPQTGTDATEPVPLATTNKGPSTGEVVRLDRFRKK